MPDANYVKRALRNGRKYRQLQVNAGYNVSEVHRNVTSYVIAVFWFVMPCGLVRDYHCFTGTYLLLQDEVQTSVQATKSHGNTIQKITTDIFTHIRTSNFNMSLHSTKF
jgi:hypothetical protein